MRILVATNLPDVRNLVADLSLKSSEISAEFVSDVVDLEPMLNGRSVPGQIVVMPGTAFSRKKHPAKQVPFIEHPETRILALIEPECSPAQTRRILLNGATGAVTTDVSPDQFALAAKLVSLGTTVVVRSAPDKHLPHHEIGQLSDRELQVLKGVCDGSQNKEIAHDFGIKEVTVKMHVRAIIRKLGAHNRTHAAMIARDLGLCYWDQ